MSRTPGREAWARASFALGGAVLLLLVYLGLRPGGRGPVLAYTWGPLLLGSASAALFVYGLVRSLRRRPLLDRGRLPAFLTLAACVWVCSFPLAYPSSYEGHPSLVEFRLPLDGEHRVRWGGEGRRENALVLMPSRRFGVVFEVRATAATPRVRAPAAGRVAGQRPSRFVPGAQAVILEVAPEEYLVVDGLAAPGAVVDGQRVVQGEELGAAAGEILSVHLEDAPEPGTGEGVPLLFRAYLADGRPVARGTPRQGERVRPAPPERD